MVVIGTTYASGKVIKVGNMADPANWTMELVDMAPPPEGTLDAAMDAVASDLRRAPDALLEPLGAMLIHHDVVAFDPRGFDALVHVRHVTAAEETFENITHEISRSQEAARREARSGKPSWRAPHYPRPSRLDTIPMRSLDASEDRARRPGPAPAASGEPAGWTAANVLNTYRRVGEGFIRMEADEISYPLHIILRYRIERALLSDDLKVADLPGAWAELSQALFGRVPPTDAQGCLQDFHWSAGLFGFFPNYALGASLAAQLFERAVADDPTVLSSLADGDFGPYRAWVKPRVHERASTVSFATLVRDATGAPLSAAALKRHLRRRYIEEPPPF
jgi:hypothetical protein